MPRITVITATYNSSKTLRLALQSLLAQDFADYEAWIVGDACTDDSEQVVASFGDKRLNWTNLAQNSGSQATPNNEGLRRAAGEYVAYLGHDDLWFPWHLSGLLEQIERTGADLVHALGAMYTPQGMDKVVGPPGPGSTYADHFVFPSSWLHRRELVPECGGWGDHAKLTWGVDMELLRRMFLAGKRIECRPKLSVLKFPSAFWAIYAWQGVPPQYEHLQRIIETSEEYYQEKLAEIALLCARQSSAQPQIRQLAMDMLLRLRSEAIRWYGRDRTPLHQYLVWRFQKARIRKRKQRGLP